MFILSNGDVCEDEEIYGESIYEYPDDETEVLDEDDDFYAGQCDERIEDMINEWESRM